MRQLVVRVTKGRTSRLVSGERVLGVPLGESLEELQPSKKASAHVHYISS
jgi:hypothetical protein